MDQPGPGLTPRAPKSRDGANETHSLGILGNVSPIVEIFSSLPRHKITTAEGKLPQKILQNQTSVYSQFRLPAHGIRLALERGVNS